MISIINYGLGNLGSITNMLRYLGVPSEIIAKPDELYKASKLILPGVGAFDAGMRHLRDHKWIEPINESVLLKKTPILGICLGMQLMTNGSDEGILQGLNWIDANTQRFPYDEKNKLKIPHMGWTDVSVTKASILFPQLDEYNRFYFVHSYYVNVNNVEDQILTSRYGINYTVGFNRDNIFGVQFHPEKSHKFGMRLLRRFAAL